MNKAKFSVSDSDSISKNSRFVRKWLEKYTWYRRTKLRLLEERYATLKQQANTYVNRQNERLTSGEPPLNAWDEHHYALQTMETSLKAIRSAIS
ncbi:MAG: hypothetical protein RLZZ69_619 [Cyanobacteriota bacterium]